MKPTLHIFILILAITLSAIYVNTISKLKVNFADQALGSETKRYTAKKAEYSIHAVELDSVVYSSIIQHFDTTTNTIFFLGNSQTHSINQIKPGEVNYIELLSNRVSNNVFCHSMPNGSLQEFLVSFTGWKNRLNISHVVIPIFMDDLREDGIRPFFIENFLSSGIKISDNSEVAKKINLELDRLKRTVIDTSSKDLHYITLQDRVEKWLIDILTENTIIWNQRENIRGTVFLKLYEWRNSIFNINATTKRRMIPGRYKDNFKALEEILRTATKNNISSFVYIPPIRNDVELPYDTLEYDTFKKEVEGLAIKYNAKFRNWENIVPGILWGYKKSTNASDKPELDFMHFQAAGHKILADSLYNFLNQ